MPKSDEFALRRLITRYLNRFKCNRKYTLICTIYYKQNILYGETGT